ncbi:MAG: acyl-CoA dehydrogenase family protein [Pseudomonadota bacterium]|uniref:Acyl-CoA dehydrogenase n=2 Tax=Sphingobium xenophagum TaxID=121428 RepID=A0A249MSM2_SPHXE|nr:MULTISPECIES: acyl-CoA dehydrogenase family protein [Sphingobium]ASY44194.1 acyl-CoA dehydrogenase [Sphingobium xenophagum]OUC56275.1 acyl-CoA dehydrogenase [Sphingobium sp. GW456-12-10-14-TSB1]QWT15518.1 acyl-CoA dehydrogenase family protein [Sphingobium xenophagum]
MDFEQSPKSREWMERVRAFMEEHIVPAVPLYHQQSAAIDRWTEIPPIFDELKGKARQAGLWNIFMPPSEHDDEFFTSVGLTNVEYAPIAELMGRISFASEVFNCMAPDTGNFEVLHRYGTADQKQRFMVPLRDGETRSAFLMTEPAVASSDARNIQTDIRRDGSDYVINGRKWWSSGAGHPRCDFFIVMGKTDADAAPYRQQSMILVPRHTPGVTLVRHLPVFGYDHAPHGHFEVALDNVRVPAENMLLGEGRGFEIAQGRLGPGRIHHTMRNIATMEVALEKMCRRLLSRRAFGKVIAEHSVWEERIARARCEIEMARLLCLKAAHKMDVVGSKAARAEIAMIKIAAPKMAQQIVDDAIQAHGGGGVSDDFGLAELWANTRIVRLTDGPDEVHERQLARMELAKYAEGKGA